MTDAKINVDQAMTIIWNALNKASKNGVFTIDESVVIKNCMETIKTEIKTQ